LKFREQFNDIKEVMLLPFQRNISEQMTIKSDNDPRPIYQCSDQALTAMLNIQGTSKLRVIPNERQTGVLRTYTNNGTVIVCVVLTEFSKSLSNKESKRRRVQQRLSKGVTFVIRVP
jgi:hypothetical protein